MNMRNPDKWLRQFKQRNKIGQREVNRKVNYSTNDSYELSRKRDSLYDQPSSMFMAYGTETTKPVTRYEGEMAKRELAAQKEIEMKSKQVAPAYSKGAYQYITDTNNLNELGRKL